MRIIDLKQMQYIGDGSHTKGRLHTGRIGKEKETKNLNVVDVFTV
jgi:hypothetical protein